MRGACAAIYDRYQYEVGILMPACPRSHIVASGEVGVYHCWSRCVRRAFLCGFDPVKKKNYNYRRAWIRKLEQQLARLFAIDIAFHAELRNHIHLILRTRPDIAQSWSDEEVVRRWLQIAQLKRGRRDEPTEPTEARICRELAREGRVDQLRRRLSNVSWFMGALCENVARRSNIEDGCSGHFWEGRFGSRDLADESAVLVCGIYVDLNPIRAGEAMAPEQARHTSAYDRIEGRKQRLLAAQSAVARFRQGSVAVPEESAGESSPEMPPDGWLCELTLASGPGAEVRSGIPSATPWRASDKGILSLGLDEYLKLLDWTGRKIVSGKRGAIPADLAPILDRLHIDGSFWLDAIESFDKKFGHVVASAAGLAEKAAQVGRRWFRGVTAATQLFH
jgi:hypothetical protein